MMLFHRIVLSSTALVLTLGSVAVGQDRTQIVEKPLNWLVNPLEKNGYTYPSLPTAYDSMSFKEDTIDAVTACKIIDQVFANAGYSMKRDVLYDRNGVAFRATGFDEQHRVGYVWGVLENLDEGFVDRKSDSEEERRLRISAKEVRELARRAPMNREFFAVFFPHMSLCGYHSGYFRNAEEEAKLVKEFETSRGARLAKLESLVLAYIKWLSDRRAEEYPAPSPKPRNLLTFDRWNKFIPRKPRFGECPVGNPKPLIDKFAIEAITSCFEKEKLELNQSFVYKTNENVSLTLTGFDAQQKIGFVWSYPVENKAQRDAFKELAKQVEADGLKIAWINPLDSRFDNRGTIVTYYADKYATRRVAIEGIEDKEKREKALQELKDDCYRDNSLATTQRLKRRVVEFLEWAQEN